MSKARQARSKFEEAYNLAAVKNDLQAMALAQGLQLLAKAVEETEQDLERKIADVHNDVRRLR